MLAIAMGGLHTLAAAASHSMNADGISYLDIGDAYFRGDWVTAINSVWSPLYSWVLGAVMAVVRPSMRWEFPLVHLVNFAIYLGAMLCFEVFWRRLWLERQESAVSEPGRITWPEWAWWSIGYLLFSWSSLALIEIWAVTPDMLMAALTYLAAAQLIRIRQGCAGRKAFTILGALLGLAYLAKAVMFPLALVFLAAAAVSAGIPVHWPDTVRRFSVGLAVFLLVALPFVLLISVRAGKPTFGEAGMITYVRYANGVPYPHWQGSPPGNGTPIHPSRLVHDSPPIYEFGSPIKSTYPISLDPVYWYRGVEISLDLYAQAGRLLKSALYYFDLFFHQLGVLTATLLIFLFAGNRGREAGPGRLSRWSVALPALAGLGLYSLVLAEGRYVGVFMVLLLAELMGNCFVPDSPIFRGLVPAAGALVAFVLLANLADFNLQGWQDLNRNQAASATETFHPPRWPGEVSQELHRLGIQPGDPVAVIGYGFDSFWARLAHVRIVAEMLDRDAGPFWTGSPQLQSDVVQAFAGAGARAIVAEAVPPYANLLGWKQVDSTNYYIYLNP